MYFFEENQISSKKQHTATKLPTESATIFFKSIKTQKNAKRVKSHNNEESIDCTFIQEMQKDILKETEFEQEDQSNRHAVPWQL